MSVWDNKEKDNLNYEIELFLETHTITDLLEIVFRCVRTKEEEYEGDE